ncbi:MAG: hypothetical protein IBX55_20730 [Methyloprofundus sp.]|nr:hypothetical protein [Methyloprofundus sp.]
MATPSENLAKSLQSLKALQDEGLVAIHTSKLSRTDRERLIKQGFLREVMKGWYISSSPNEKDGDSTPWYTAFWRFCGQYLDARFGGNWSLSPNLTTRLMLAPR